MIMFIVIEGIDGAGCETQAKNLKSLIEQKNGLSPLLLKYPDYQKNIGQLIRQFLYENKNLTAEKQFLLYTLQFIFDNQLIHQKRKEEIIIADRYFPSTLCYQTLEGFDLQFALQYAKIFKIEKPEIIVFLDVPPDLAIKRKQGEAKEKNRREKDFEFIKKTYHQYQKLIKNQVWAPWLVVDGRKKIDEITVEIYNKLLKLWKKP